MTKKLPIATSYKAPSRKALVLCSGGLDSVAALHWARRRGLYDEIEAIGFWYGQPHGPAELAAAGRICGRLGVRFVAMQLGESVRGFMRTLPVPKPGRDAKGVSKANMAGRNAIFLSAAAAHAAHLWADEDATVALVIAANRDDQVAFPDCRVPFLDFMAKALHQGLRDVITHLAIDLPWVDHRKHEIITWAAQDPDALRDIRESVSCYAGTRCGVCDACTLRAQSFAAAGVEDGTGVEAFHGGDPAREASR